MSGNASAFGAMCRYLPAATLLAAIAITGNVAPAAADPVVEFTEYSSPTYSATASSLGWSFTTNEAITVTALDAFDPGSGTQVRLYDSGGLITSATVSTSDSQEGSPTPFYTVAITPVTLAAGQTYYIAEDNPGGDELPYEELFGGGLTVNSAITYVQQVFSFGTGGDPTSDIYGSYGSPGVFGPDFDIETAVVPEPASLTLVAAGLAGLASRQRRRAGVA